MNRFSRITLLFKQGSKPSRTVLSGLGIALGMALFLSVQLINRATLEAFRENAESVAGRAALTVFTEGSSFPEEILARVEKVAGVQHAVPMTENMAYFVNRAGKTETLHVLGIDLLKEQSVRTYKTTDNQIIDDPLVFLNQPDSIILTHEFAQKHGFEMDSKLPLLTAQGKRLFTVRGLLTPEGPAKAFGGALAIMDIDAQRLVFGKEGRLDRIDVVPRGAQSTEALARAIRAELGESFSADPPNAQSASLEKMVQSFQGILSFLSTLALLVALFLVGNSVSVSVAERRSQIGTLRAIGATRGWILLLFLAENFALGLIASLVGVGLGQVLARLLLDSVLTSLSTQFLAHISIPSVALRPVDLIVALTTGTATCLLAALWPAARATRVPPLEAIRPPQATDTGRGSRFWQISPLIGLALLVYLTGMAVFGIAAENKGLETLHILLAILAAALLAPSAILACLRLLRSAVSFEKWPVLRLSIENTLRSPGRTASNSLSLTVGLLLVVVIACVSASFQGTIEDWSRRGMSDTDLMVTSQGKWTQMQIQPLEERLAEKIAAVPGVLPLHQGGVFGLRIIKLSFEDRTIALKALDAPRERRPVSYIDAIGATSEELGDRLFQLGDPAGPRPILVSDHFARNFRKAVGQTIELKTPQGLRPFRIEGLVRDFVNPEGVIYLSREAYKEIWKDPLIDIFAIKAEPGVSHDQVRNELDQRLGQSEGLVAIKTSEAVEDLRRNIEQSFAFNRAIELAALLTGLLGLLNTLLVSVLERKREIAMLRALGTSASQISRMILIEGMLIGVLGALAAAGLGYVISLLWVKSSLSHVLGWVLDYHLPWSAILTALLAGVAVSMLAGLWPAFRASRVEVVEALRDE